MQNTDILPTRPNTARTEIPTVWSPIFPLQWLDGSDAARSSQGKIIQRVAATQAPKITAKKP